MSSSPRPTTGAPGSSVIDHPSAAVSSRSPPSPPPPNQRWASHQVDKFELPAETTARHLPASYKDHEPTAMAESSGEDHEPMAPKRRAEKWAQEEALCLVALRREVDGLFNISKSNRHLWCRISAGMRENGFDRSPTMCTDKWRNLLKEFKKARQRRCGGGAKVCCFKEIEDLLRERCKNVDAFVHLSDRASGRYARNSEGRVDHDGHSLAITAADTVATGEAPSWNWMDATGNGGDSQSSYGGRVILVKWGEYARKIGIDGTTDAIKDVIKSAFGLRTKRAFWLEDEDEVIRSLDRRMPLGTYTLHLDEGLGIKICFYDERDRIPVQTEAKTLYSEDDFRDFLARRGWTHLRQLDDGFKCVDSFDELHEGGIYQGVRIFGDAL